MRRLAVFAAVLTLLATASTAGAQGAGSVILTPPSQASAQTSAPANVTNVTLPPPDPAATRAMYQYSVATLEHDHAGIPVGWAQTLLAGENIWTRTPPAHFQQDDIKRLRLAARNAALGLFLLGILYTGAQLAFGAASGSTNYQQVLPLVIAGFLVAIYAETIVTRSIDICNWLNERLGNPSLSDFSLTGLTMPEQPDADAPTGLAIPAAFFSGLFTSLLYAIILVILEMKLIFREAVLVVASVVMPLSGILWAFQITRGYGLILYRLFFGWLFGQPMVVVCLAIAGSLLTLMNTAGPGEVLVKCAILILSIKMISIFASGMSPGGMFGLAGLLFLMRRMQSIGRGGPQNNSSAPPANAPAVQPGGAGGGTGAGAAATGRPWRPALGSA